MDTLDFFFLYLVTYSLQQTLLKVYTIYRMIYQKLSYILFPQISILYI